MKRTLKFAAIFLAALAVTPVAAFFAYDLIVFQPKRQEIAALIAQADPQDRHPPPSIRRYLALAREPITIKASQWLGDRLGMTGASSETRRPGPDILVKILIELHLSKDEILSLYASLAYTGQGQYGLNSLSHRLFAKPLDTLSETEAATVVAALQAPSRLLPDRERLEKQRGGLLALARALARANRP